MVAAERPVGSAGHFPVPDTAGLLSHINTRQQPGAGHVDEVHRAGLPIYAFNRDEGMRRNGTLYGRVRTTEFGVRREKGSRIARFGESVRGKSGLRRARCRVTPGRREAMESVTENRPPMAASVAQARVKRWGKSPPRAPATAAARQTPPGARPSRSERRPAAFELRVGCTRRRVTGVPER